MASSASQMTATALANWYGSNRMLACHVGEELKGCSWVGIPFAGGMCEIPHIAARQLLVNDRHRHVINLARVARDPVLGAQLYRQLKRYVFHPDELEAAQESCQQREKLSEEAFHLFGPARAVNVPFPAEDRLAWAVDYFVTSWMGRGGKGGTVGEFRGGLPIRWNASGGGSAVRYFSAVHSLMARRRTLRRCEFTLDDAYDFLAKVVDSESNGVYADPPFPGPGEKYTHGLGLRGHERLAEAASRFKLTRVVMRFYDVPLIRQLYPEGEPWVYLRRSGRAQDNSERREILITNGASRSSVAVVNHAGGRR